MAEGIQISGKKLRAMRERLVLTQTEFASALGVSYQNLRRVETLPVAGIRPDFFRSIAEVAKRSFEDLRRDLAPEQEEEASAAPLNALALPPDLLMRIQRWAKSDQMDVREWALNELTEAVTRREEQDAERRRAAMPAEGRRGPGKGPT